MRPSRIPVSEIMTPEPVTTGSSLPMDKAASMMRDRGIGSLIVVKGDAAVGIVTERDVVTKVAADNRKPSTLRVRDVMTSPVIAIHPHDDVEQAARLMNARRIRRLAVVQDGKLVGVVTENDVLRILPNLIEVTREWAKVGMLEEPPLVAEGHCDSCGVYSTELEREGKILVCPDCRGG